MSYCPAKDSTTQNIKRANEKKKKLNTMKPEYRTSKARNQYSVGIDLGGERGFGRFQKVYR